MEDTSRSQPISTKLLQIAKQAREYPEMVFTTLMHHIDVDFLLEAYKRTRKDKAPGLSQMNAKEYAKNLEENLEALYQKMKSGQYKAPPIKRVWIEKEDGRKRAIGIPEFEDKVVQRACVMVLEAIYEEDFYKFSYGYRAGKSAHQALGELRERCMEEKLNWVIDADISGFFDNLSHEQMEEFLKKRIKDGTLLRFIGKWLKAGVVEKEVLKYPEKGTPQGGVISPLLSNIYLHYVLDEWYVKEVKPRLKGESVLIRFADDFVIGCEEEEDAKKVMEVIPKRFAKYGLEINGAKTKLIEFKKPDSKEEGKGKGSFDFLGFTHYWTRSRKKSWVIKRKTASKRQKRSMKKIWEFCKVNRHEPIKEQHSSLSKKLLGSYNYYGIRGNYKSLDGLYNKAKGAWKYWLSQRSRTSQIDWLKMNKLLEILPLPKPRIIHQI